MAAHSPHLVYFADPMCSWCWGFSGVVGAIRERHADLPMRVVMGGLRPGTRDPMTDTDRSTIRSHWEHVHEASGQPFDFGFFEREGFVYDTEPASRAVVVARRDGDARAFEYLHRVHAAFYAENRDVTSAEVLADVAADVGLDRDAFLGDLATDEASHETVQDFMTSRNAGITGFPTLIAGAGADGAYSLITQGFQPADRILAAIEHWLDPKQAG